MEKARVILCLLTIAVTIGAVALVITALVAVFPLDYRTPFEIRNAILYRTAITCGLI